MKREPYLAAALTYAITLALNRADTIAARTTRDIATMQAWRDGVPMYALAGIDCVHRMTVHRRVTRAITKVQCNTVTLDVGRPGSTVLTDAPREVSETVPVQGEGNAERRANPQRET